MILLLLQKTNKNPYSDFLATQLNVVIFREVLELFNWILKWWLVSVLCSSDNKTIIKVN